MKRLFLIFLSVILLSGGVYGARKKKKTTVRITLIEGVVSNCLVRRQGETEWRRARIKERLKAGDEVKTLDGVRIEMVNKAGVVMRLNQNSHFTVKEFKEKKKGITARMKLWLGKSWFKIKKITQRRISFEAETPSAVAGVYGTTYRVDVGDDKSTSVRVYSGAVKVGNLPHEVMGPTELLTVEPHEVPGPREVPGPTEVSKKEWDFIVKTMQQVTVSFDNKEIEKSEFDFEEDEKEEWVKWNKRRDAQLDWEE